MFFFFFNGEIALSIAKITVHFRYTISDLLRIMLQILIEVDAKLHSRFIEISNSRLL